LKRFAYCVPWTGVRLSSCSRLKVEFEVCIAVAF
jgi:hypothetical protein